MKQLPGLIWEALEGFILQVRPPPPPQPEIIFDLAKYIETMIEKTVQPVVETPSAEILVAEVVESNPVKVDISAFSSFLTEMINPEKVE